MFLSNLLKIAGRGVFRDDRGAVAVEFALVSFLMVFFLLNGVEFARYAFQKMQVENAVHAAAMSVWKICDIRQTPAETKCTLRDAAISSGLQSSTLTPVTQSSGSPTEGYYCIDTTGNLVEVAPVTGPRPSSCTAQGDPAHAPGDYIAITASFPYTPMFVGVSFVSLLPPTISSTGFMRLL